MTEAVCSVILAGRGLLRWPAGEERVKYRVTVGLDGIIWVDPYRSAGT